jgi:hypothetical protein
VGLGGGSATLEHQVDHEVLTCCLNPITPNERRPSGEFKPFQVQLVLDEGLLEVAGLSEQLSVESACFVLETD